MKKLVPALLLIASIAACSKKNNPDAAGTLTGVDMTMCACCGGVVLEIDNRPGTFRIDSLPFMPVEQLMNMTFPKRIQFDYGTTDTCGGIQYLNVSSYFLSN